METIDVRGLPEPLARAVEAMVRTLREQFNGKEQQKRPVKLPVWKGTVKGSLRREDIYDDVT
ncbi:hypothetical protein [Candidatus Entotheonella palauensis]|uniref:hypothetical protein n=1 Tax=Candidatus Entotheonella palauensis TaxID=93172 RepID=UPI000B7EB946|nr:hypothetical protein [Candidatus Entotheonella palauensis]